MLVRFSCMSCYLIWTKSPSFFRFFPVDQSSLLLSTFFLQNYFLIITFLQFESRGEIGAYLYIFTFLSLFPRYLLGKPSAWFTAFKFYLMTNMTCQTNDYNLNKHCGYSLTKWWLLYKALRWRKLWKFFVGISFTIFYFF